MKNNLPPIGPDHRLILIAPCINSPVPNNLISALKKKVVCSSRMLVFMYMVYMSMWCCNPEDQHQNFLFCKILKT